METLFVLQVSNNYYEKVKICPNAFCIKEMRHFFAIHTVVKTCKIVIILS